jgi:hypothetical protein
MDSGVRMWSRQASRKPRTEFVRSITEEYPIEVDHATDRWRGGTSKETSGVGEIRRRNDRGGRRLVR